MPYSREEEFANSMTHAAGILLGIITGSIFMVRCIGSGDRWAIWSVGLYLFGMLSSYTTSTVYHALPEGMTKARIRKWDHAAIYWHIAGSYSPLTLIAMRNEGAWGIALFCFIWKVAIVGTASSFIRLKKHSNFETVCYVLMGLSVTVAFGPLWRSAGTIATSWIIAEGVMFITGAVFYSLYKKPYMHTVFHVFVLFGSFCHIVAVWHILGQYL